MCVDSCEDYVVMVVLLCVCVWIAVRTVMVVVLLCVCVDSCEDCDDGSVAVCVWTAVRTM